MKRFYDEVAVTEVDDGWQVTLDGRGLRTVNRGHQIVPTRALADMLAEEWARQGEDIDPRSFRFRDQTDYAIDVVAMERAETIDKLLAYAETDTLCFRADPEDALYRKQLEVWEPLIGDIETRHGITLTRTSGVIHRPHAPESVDALRQTLDTFDAFTLAGLLTMASLSASLCIALSALEDNADPDALWNAASLEEEWQADLWGRDSEAEQYRAKKREDFTAAFEWTRAARA